MKQNPVALLTNELEYFHKSIYSAHDRLHYVLVERRMPRVQQKMRQTIGYIVHVYEWYVVSGQWRYVKYKSMGNIEKKTLKRNERVVAYSQSQRMSVHDEY